MTEVITVCPLCSGKVEEKKTEKIIKVGKDVVILKVKAGVCQQCGETIYTKEAHEEIQKIRSELKDKIKELIPVGHAYVYPVGI